MIYAFYDRMGIIDFHVIESLRKYNNFFSIIFVSNVKIKKDELDKISFVEKIIISDHQEMDFGSWKLGLEFLKPKKVDEILLVNDSIIGPTCSIQEILDKMSSKKCDFWGVTSAGNDSNFHIQSYFLYFKKKCLRSEYFKNFFSQISKQKSKADLVKKYEIGLTQGLISNGMSCDSLLPNFEKDIFSKENCINLFLKKQLPFFKVKNLVSNPYRIKKMFRVFDILKPKEKYFSYIRRLNQNSSLNHLYFLIPQFKKTLISKRFILIRSKIVFKNRLWRFYIKFLGVYIFFFLLPISSNNKSSYRSDANYF